MNSSYLNFTDEIKNSLKRFYTLSSLRRDLSAYFLRKKVGNVTYGRFLKVLLEKKILKEHWIKLNHKPVLAFYSTTEDIDPYALIEIWPQNYFCNLTSVFYHGLTNQIPNTIYLAKEGVGRQKDKAAQRSAICLTDQQIFNAFIKPHRITKKIYTYKDYKFVLTERVDREQVGVIDTTRNSKRLKLPKGARMTSLERALIDACIAPHYNGGITSVVSYFYKAKGQLDISRLLEIYNRLMPVYPYWQAIGFICDELGFKKEAERIYKSFKIKNKFYMDHNAKTSWLFNRRWSIYYPQGIF